MNLCSDGHDEVCYDNKKCPVCEVIAEKDSVEMERDNLLARVEELEEEADQ